MKPETIISPEGKEVVLVHYIVEGRIVCMPDMQLKDMGSKDGLSAPRMRIDALEGVTCPLCKKAAK